MPAVFDRDQIARVEGLLATVQELTSTLRRTSDELGREVARALYLDGEGGGVEAQALEVENDRLRHAVEGRAVIDQATGMVMAVRSCTADEAAGVLSALARAGDRTLREVAADVVATSFRLPSQPAPTSQPTLEPWGTAAAVAASMPTPEPPPPATSTPTAPSEGGRAAGAPGGSGAPTVEGGSATPTVEGGSATPTTTGGGGTPATSGGDGTPATVGGSAMLTTAGGRDTAAGGSGTATTAGDSGTTATGSGKTTTDSGTPTTADGGDAPATMGGRGATTVGAATADAVEGGAGRGAGALGGAATPRVIDVRTPSPYAPPSDGPGVPAVPAVPSPAATKEGEDPPASLDAMVNPPRPERRRLNPFTHRR